MTGRGQRIVLYSHDTQGLGHIRRNLSIATTLVNVEPSSTILLIAGVRQASDFTMPPGVDCLTLPAISKDSEGQYRPRSLALTLKDLIDLRANTIQTVLKSFEPDVLIIDKVPLGIFGELKPGLDWLRNHGRTRCVLGLREVLDDPQTTRREWRLTASDAAIRAYYDAIWVYGDPRVYDPVNEYCFSDEVAAKVRYTGYLGRPVTGNLTGAGNADPLAALEAPPSRLALCLVGGGQDGYDLADAFLQADLPPGTNGVVVTGPFMPPEARQSLHRRAATHPRQRIVEFVEQPECLLSRADNIVAMGGYNTICEVLSFEKRALIVPRVKPRREQLIRAERLRELGVLDMLHPADLKPAALTEWLARDPGSPRGIGDRVDLGGLARLPDLLAEVLTGPSHRSVCSRLYTWVNLDGLAHLSGRFARAFIVRPHTEEVHRVNR